MGADAGVDISLVLENSAGRWQLMCAGVWTVCVLEVIGHDVAVRGTWW